MQRDEIRALRRLQREQGLSSHVFMTEREGPMTPKAFHALFGQDRRAGENAVPSPPSHVEAWLRLRVSQCRPRHTGATGLARAQKHSARGALYRVPEIVTRGRFPDGGESDSTWRTREARHVGSDTIAPGF